MMGGNMVRALWKVRTFARMSSFTRALCSGRSVSDAVLKNVTKSNFEPALAELRRYVKDADFVAIDLEMTGITSAPWRESFEFDRPDVQYLKVKDSVEKFAVVQFGVCPFRWDSLTQSLVAHPHNFYIFPRQVFPLDGSSYEFSCQTSSLEFLAKYQFDFNLCIYEGISYLSRSQEVEALRGLSLVYEDEISLSSAILKKVPDTQPVRMADILFFDRIKKRIYEWRAGLLSDKILGSDAPGSSSDKMQQFQTTFFQLRPALEMSGLTSRQLRLIKLATEKNFKDLAYVHVTDETSDPRHLIVFVDSSTDKDFLMKDVKASCRREAEKKIKGAVGFRHVIDLLSTERKLIVGHNCFLDFAHVYGKFIGPLPSTVKEFVSVLEVYFPYIVDTKVLLNSDDLLIDIMKKGRTSLSKAFTLLCPQIAYGLVTSGLVDKSQIKVEVQVDDQRFSNWKSGTKHEAGYDAFMTGCVFGQACYHLGVDFCSLDLPVDLLQNTKLQKYINHLYLSWVSGDIINLKTGNSAADYFGSSNNLQKRQNIVFSNMVVLWGMPSKLKSRELLDSLFKVFGSNSVTYFWHLDDTALVIQFNKPELVSEFLELKDHLDRENTPIAILHPLSRILDGGRVRAADYEIYGKICSSPLSEVSFTDQAEVIGIKWETRPLQLERVVEKPEHRIAAKEIEVNRYPVSQDMDIKTNLTGNLSGRCHPSDEVGDSLYLIETHSGQ